MVFQERMLHGEPTEAKSEEILKDGKEYLPLAMLMTDENSVRCRQCTIVSKVVFSNTREILQGILPLPFIHSQCFVRVIMWFKLLLPRHHYPLAAMVGKDGKLYFRLVDVGALLGRSKVYQFAKRFDNLVIQGKDVLPAHKPYPIMTQKSKLVTPDVVFNILNAKLSSLATSFAISLNAGSALVENPCNLFVESFKTAPVLHVQDSPIPNSILTCVEPERIPTPPAQRPERIPTTPVEPERPVEPKRPAEPEKPAEPERLAEPERPPLEDSSVFMDNIEVTPTLIARCDKGTQTLSPSFPVQRLDLGKRRLEPRLEPPLAPKRQTGTLGGFKQHYFVGA
ncbi:uncharacterized protein TNCV_4416751 [Trichonephila clavipes]|uniref:Uncharacterized protein n=1 Tax=Trichonephila clavipes TaxID=2585209 RepID=A0A8X6S2K2_TRICX|nr:uncharacterized protein TNCV_4416751 [Trichonephila clavipes]